MIAIYPDDNQPVIITEDYSLEDIRSFLEDTIHLSFFVVLNPPTLKKKPEARAEVFIDSIPDVREIERRS